MGNLPRAAERLLLLLPRAEAFRGAILTTVRVSGSESDDMEDLGVVELPKIEQNVAMIKGILEAIDIREIRSGINAKTLAPRQRTPIHVF